jgi:protein-S-isoprenylcysteine O-methyltransferase Ste14
MGGTFFLTLVALFVLAAVQVDKSVGFPKFLSEPFNIFLSVPLLAAGLFLMLWSVFHFVKAKGTPVPLNPPPKLVTAGPYAYVRNPMLSGVFILLFGLGILSNSLSLTFIFTPLFILVTVLELKAIEEPELEKRLGEEYVEYRNRVPMFFPRLWVRTKK